jgi:hypothetical protein
MERVGPPDRQLHLFLQMILLSPLWEHRMSIGDYAGAGL